MTPFSASAKAASQDPRTLTFLSTRVDFSVGENRSGKDLVPASGRASTLFGGARHDVMQLCISARKDMIVYPRTTLRTLVVQRGRVSVAGVGKGFYKGSETVVTLKTDVIFLGRV